MTQNIVAWARGCRRASSVRSRYRSKSKYQIRARQKWNFKICQYSHLQKKCKSIVKCNRNFLEISVPPHNIGDRGSTVVNVLRYKSEGRWFDPRWCHGIFQWQKHFWSRYGPGVDSASNRNEYQVYFLGGKCGRCLRLTTLPPSCAVVKKSGNVNFLENSRQLEACNGTALPLPLPHNVLFSFLVYSEMKHSTVQNVGGLLCQTQFLTLTHTYIENR
jgi:hypothetical protein